MKKLLIKIFTFTLGLKDRFFIFFIDKLNKKVSIFLVRNNNVGEFIIWLSSVEQKHNEFNQEQLITVADKSFTELLININYYNKVVDVDVPKYIYNILYLWQTLTNVSNLNSRMVIEPCIFEISYESK